jgi:biotin carboxylase
MTRAESRPRPSAPDGIVLVGARASAIHAAHRLGLRILLAADRQPPPSIRPLVDRFVLLPPSHEADWARLLDRLTGGGLPRAVAATTERAVVPAAHLRQAAGLPGTDVSIALRCTDKVAMKRAVGAAGLRHAAFVSAEDALDAAGLRARLGLPMVLKDRVSSGSRGTRTARSAEDVPDRLDGSRMAESLVRGREMSCEALIVERATVFLNFTEYYEPCWSNIVPLRLDGAWRERVEAVLRGALAALGVERGLAHLEVFLADQGVVFGEMALRPPGGFLMTLIERVYEFDVWTAWLRVEMGDLPVCPRTACGFAGVRLLHPGAGRVRSVDGLEAMRAHAGVVEVECRLHPGDVVPPRLGTGQSRGHVLVAAPTRDEVARTLDAVGDRIRIEMEPGYSPGAT